jgi:hypothetical protein
MRIVLYSDTESLDITEHTQEVTFNNSIFEPYGSANIYLKLPLPLLFNTLPMSSKGTYNLNSWCCIYDKLNEDSRERAVFLGCLTSINTGISSDNEGHLKSSTVSLSFDTWLHPLRDNEIFLSANSPLEGHILDLKDFGERFRKLASIPLNTYNVGDVLEEFFKEFSKLYRLPSTLSNLDLSSFVKVASSNSTANLNAPERASIHRDVFGIALNAVKGSINVGSSSWSTLRAIFNSDTNMIELFPSLEKTDTPTNEIEKKLGVKVCLVYRIKPFAFGEISNQGDLEQTSYSIEKAEDVAYLLHDIYSIDFSQNDQDRVNGVFIHTPLNQSRGVELFGVTGTPIFDEEDISQTGLRMYNGNWSYFPRGKKNKDRNTYKKETQYLIDLFSKIVGQAHKFFDGTIRLHQDLNIKVGSWVAVEINRIKLVCYVSTVTHTIRTTEDGLITRESNIEFDRGFIV